MAIRFIVNTNLYQEEEESISCVIDRFGPCRRLVALGAPANADRLRHHQHRLFKQIAGSLVSLGDRLIAVKGPTNRHTRHVL